MQYAISLSETRGERLHQETDDRDEPKKIIFILIILL